MIWKGRKYCKSNTLCARESTEEDFYVDGKPIKGHGLVIVRYKDCPITRTEVRDDGVTVSYREPKGVQGVPLSFHTDTHVVHSAVKKDRSWHYRHVYLVDHGRVYTRRDWLETDEEVQWAMDRDNGIRAQRPVIREEEN